MDTRGLGTPCWGHRCPRSPAQRQQSQDKPDPGIQSNSPSSYTRGCPSKKAGATSLILPAPAPLVPPFPPFHPSQGCWWSPATKHPQQDRGTWPPPPRARAQRGQGQPSPSGLGGQERRCREKPRQGTQAPAPPRSLALARQAHQLEDVLVLGHDGELQHIVTAGREDGGVRAAGGDPPPAPREATLDPPPRGQMSPSPHDGRSPPLPGPGPLQHGDRDVPVLDQRDHLRVGFPDDALPVHLDQPVPCRARAVGKTVSPQVSGEVVARGCPHGRSQQGLNTDRAFARGRARFPMARGAVGTPQPT